MRFLCALCVLCGLGCSAVAIDREAFTFTKYDLEIRLEPEQQRLGARGKITLRNDSAQPQKIGGELDFRGQERGIPFERFPLERRSLGEAVFLRKLAADQMVHLGIRRPLRQRRTAS